MQESTRYATTGLPPGSLTAAKWVIDGARPPLIAIAITCLLLAFAFLGSRGIWDPDEGRYTNVALTMLDTGDWLNPMRNEDTGHWTKPPVTYWLIAGSVAAFGQTPCAARLPIAASYLTCVLLTGLCARRLFPGTQVVASVAYATMLATFGASQLITTDYPLAAAQALAMYAFVEYRFAAARRPQLWLLLMWVAYAIAFMTKGPPALVTLLAIIAFAVLVPARRCRWYWHALGVAVFLTLALPWYIAVALRHEGLMQYFLGAELVDRVASNRFGRNGDWYGWITIYVPTLVLGTLPWTRDLWAWARSLPKRIGEWRWSDQRAAQAPAVFVALWIAVPLLVFCLARSRLPLYLLPIFLPMALAIASQRGATGKGLPRVGWLTALAVALMASRLAVASFPTHKDASAWAEAIRSRVHGPVTEVVFVEDMARYGLHLHLDTEIEKLSMAPIPQPRFNPEYDEPLIREVEEIGHEHGLVFVTKTGMWPRVERQIATYGYRTRALGAPYQGRVIFEVLHAQEPLPW